MRERIARLHSSYQLLTGNFVPLDMLRERQWFDWLEAVEKQIRGGPFPADFTAEQALREVVHAIVAGIRAQKRNRGALKFSNLIGCWDRFQEELAEARSAATAAGRPRPPATVVVRTPGPKGVTERRVAGGGTSEAARPAGDVLASEAFRQFVKLKEKL